MEVRNYQVSSLQSNTTFNSYLQQICTTLGNEILSRISDNISFGSVQTRIGESERCTHSTTPGRVICDGYRPTFGSRTVGLTAAMEAETVDLLDGGSASARGACLDLNLTPR